MRTFDFDTLPGFPLDQLVLKQMQSHYKDGLEAFCKSLKATEPFVLGGCEVTTYTSTPDVDIAHGLIWHPAYGLCSFDGASGLYDIDTTERIAFEVVTEPLIMEDTSTEDLVTYCKAYYINSSSEGTYWADVVNKHWWMYLGKQVTDTSPWVKFYDVTTGTTQGELYYHLNPITNVVSIRGKLLHAQNASSATETWSHYITALPDAIKPVFAPYSWGLQFYTSLQKSSSGGYISVIEDANGNVYDQGIVVVNTGLLLITRKLATGTTLPWHIINITYQI